MSARRPTSDDRYHGPFDPAPAAVEGAPSPEGSEDGDAVAAALRMDMLGAGADTAGLEPPRRSIVASQNVLLLLVLAAAGGALFAMRSLGMGPRSSLADGPRLPQYDVDKRPEIAYADHKKVIAELSVSRITGQVPADQVQRNPFAMAGVIKVEEARAPQAMGESAEARAARLLAEQQQREAAERARAVQQALASITVNSVIVGGPVPVARINGELVRIGDTVADVLTVKDIHGRGVVLEADGKEYPKDMAMGPGHAAGPRPPMAPPRR
jgi:hypothetical protein